MNYYFRYAALLIISVFCNAGYVGAAPSLADDTPEQMFKQLAVEIVAGDTNAAAKHFTENPANREVLQNLTTLQRKAFSNALLNAERVKTQSSSEKKIDYKIFVYRLTMPGDDGNPMTRDISVERAPSIHGSPTGNWRITNW